MNIFRGNIELVNNVISVLYKRRYLTIEMAKQDIFGRFSGQVLGGFWAIGHPFFLMALYMFIFAGVFKQKLGGTIEMPRDFTIYLLAGLIPWLSIQESMNKGVSAIISHANLVKQVVFPIEVLPVKTVIASTFTQIIGLFILLCYSVLISHSAPWTYALLPIVLLMQIIMMIGISYALASVGTYFKDLKDVVQIFSTAGVFLVPAFFLPSQVPEVFKPLIYLNPFSHMVWVYQDVLYFGRIEHPYSWLIFFVLSISCFTLGFRLFCKLKPMFGNVL
jgi:lipopolysaccharide transport system permease protein